jgi:hypothetical protein
MDNEMNLTNRQFQGFLRLSIENLRMALEESPDNEPLIKLKDIYESMLEDVTEPQDVSLELRNIIERGDKEGYSDGEILALIREIAR